MKKVKNKNIWLMSGANLINQFIKENLVDKIIVSIQPIILGENTSLFNKNKDRKLKMLNITHYKKGPVQIHYKVKK